MLLLPPGRGPTVRSPGLQSQSGWVAEPGRVPSNSSPARQPVVVYGEGVVPFIKRTPQTIPPRRVIIHSQATIP